MSYDDTPKPFSDAQRELFVDTIGRLNRLRPDRFVEADHWIDVDVRPRTEKEKYLEFRQQKLAAAEERRRRKDRSHLVELSCPEEGRGIATYYRASWEQAAEPMKQSILQKCRTYYGHNLRFARQNYAEA